MTKTKSTKRALFMSFLSLLLCVSMLVGTTFAWFTDSVASNNNIIKAGNLDLTLEYWNGKGWADVQGSSEILDPDALYEPGYVQVVYLKLANAGTLALKYQLGINILNEKTGTNQAGDTFKLSDYIQFGIVEGVNPETAEYKNRKDAVAAVTSSKIISAGYGKADKLLAGNSLYLAMVVYMPETVDNKANHNGKDIPSIELGINAFATQYTYEEDSFDNLYDEASAAFTVADANALMAKGKDATLVNCNEPEGVLEVPAGYTGTLTLVNSTVKSVQGAGDVNMVVLGDVVVNAKGTGVMLLAADDDFDGSAISANGKLTITGKGNLTAVAADVKGAFGIGGMHATEVTVKDITIDYVSGAYAYGVGSDTKYYKDAPEGGAAIGSGSDGAVINLENVTVVKAIGGSKAAGIGARYHVGVTVNINDSTIEYVEGGVSAAGIGGSRVSDGAAENGTTINIVKSTVTAKGGAYGAGIGSGYDTHCLAKQPLCTINITDSIIDATGGKYAAGVGTGYHNAALAGEIKNSTVNAKSGEKVYKATYTAAMDIGFGVTDPAREGQQTDSKLIVNGTEITLAKAPAGAKNSAELDSAIAGGKTTIALGNGTYIIPDSAQGKTLTIIGNGESVVATQDDGSYEGCDYSLDGATVTFEGVVINTDSTTYTGYARCKGTYKNCTINGTYTLYDNSVFENCTFNVSGDVYNIWTWGAPNATFTNCTFNSDGKAMLLYGQANTKLTLDGCTFNDKGGLSDKKAAVEIGNDYGTSYKLIVNNTVVNGYEVNNKGICTYSTLWGNKNSMGTDKLNVVVDGVDVY